MQVIGIAPVSLPKLEAARLGRAQIDRLADHEQTAAKTFTTVATGIATKTSTVSGIGTLTGVVGGSVAATAKVTYLQTLTSTETMTATGTFTTTVAGNVISIGKPAAGTGVSMTGVAPSV